MTKTNFEVSKPYFRRANQADLLHHLTAAIATITKTSKTLTYKERETNLGESMLSSLSGDAGVVTVLGERPRRLTPNAAPPPPPPASPARPVPGGRESTVNPSLAAAEGGGRGKPAGEAADGGARHYPDDFAAEFGGSGYGELRLRALNIMHWFSNDRSCGLGVLAGGWCAGAEYEVRLSFDDRIIPCYLLGPRLFYPLATARGTTRMNGPL